MDSTAKHKMNISDKFTVTWTQKMPCDSNHEIKQKLPSSLLNLEEGGSVRSALLDEMGGSRNIDHDILTTYTDIALVA